MSQLQHWNFKKVQLFLPFLIFRMSSTATKGVDTPAPFWNSNIVVNSCFGDFSMCIYHFCRTVQVGAGDMDPYKYFIILEVKNPL